MRIGTLVCTLLSLFFGAVHASAQDWPAQPIALVHGFGAGGNADSIARVLAEHLSRTVGASVVVEAKAGAGGRLATEAVSRARPDGYTITLLTGAHTASAALYGKLKYDPVESFAFISLVGKFPFVVATRAEGRVTSMEGLARIIREHPGSLTFSSVGFGSTQHLTGELLALSAGGKLTHVPYRGGTQPLTDLLGGQIDLIVDSLTVAAPGIEAGTLKGLGVTSKDTWPTLPNVLPIARVIPGFEVISWVGLAAPSGTPPAIIEKIRAGVVAATQDPDVLRRLATLGVSPGMSTSQEMRDFVASEIARWNTVIDQSGLSRPN